MWVNRYLLISHNCCDFVIWKGGKYIVSIEAVMPIINRLHLALMSSKALLQQFSFLDLCLILKAFQFNKALFPPFGTSYVIKRAPQMKE